MLKNCQTVQAKLKDCPILSSATGVSRNIEMDGKNLPVFIAEFVGAEAGAAFGDVGGGAVEDDWCDVALLNWRSLESWLNVALVFLDCGNIYRGFRFTFFN